MNESLLTNLIISILGSGSIAAVMLKAFSERQKTSQQAAIKRQEIADNERAALDKERRDVQASFVSYLQKQIEVTQSTATATVKAMDKISETQVEILNELRTIKREARSPKIQSDST